MFGITKEVIYEKWNLFVSVFGLYITWVIVHFVASHLYIHWCVPVTILGFLMSPFLVPSPQCQALRWAIYNGGNSINAMWFLFGVWCMKLFKVINS